METQSKGRMSLKVFQIFRIAYGKKWNANFEDDEDMEIAVSLWDNFLKNYPEEIVMKAAEDAINHLSWPPSIAEFKEICDKQFNLPSIELVINRIGARDFRDPFIHAIFKRTNTSRLEGTLEEVIKYLSPFYQEELKTFRLKALTHEK